MLSRSSIAFFERYCQNQIRGSILKFRLADQKVFCSNVNIVFWVSGMSELSKHIFGYNSPQNSNERFFFDIATLTKWKVKTILISGAVNVALRSTETNVAYYYIGRNMLRMTGKSK